MKNFSLCILLLLSMNLLCQDFDHSSLQFSNLRISDFKKGFFVEFDYLYLDHFPDSISLDINIRLKTTNLKEITSPERLRLYKYPDSKRSGSRITAFNYGNIELNEGGYPMIIELETTDSRGYKHQLASYSIFINQPRRYNVKIEVEGGQVTASNPSGNTWDYKGSYDSGSNKPDLQWWMYVDGKHLSEASNVSRNSLLAPSAYFDFVLLRGEKLEIKLYDKDNFATDDIIGTFKINHPHDRMDAFLPSRVEWRIYTKCI